MYVCMSRGALDLVVVRCYCVVVDCRTTFLLFVDVHEVRTTLLDFSSTSLLAASV